MKKNITDIDVKGKKVFLRVDFNVPMNNDFHITDDTRIVDELPTINYLVEHGARVILCSHLGRPEGVVDPKLSLRPVVSKLTSLLGKQVTFIEDIYDENARAIVDGLNDGDIAMFENIRFLKERFCASLFCVNFKA